MIPKHPTIPTAIVLWFLSFLGFGLFPLLSLFSTNILLIAHICGFIGQGIILIGCLTIRHRNTEPRYDRSNLALPDIRSVALTFCVFIGVVLLAYCTMSPLEHQLTVLMQVFYSRSSRIPPDTAILWSDWFFGVLFAPALEELTFRGVLLQGFLARYKPSTAIIANTILFVLLHGFSGNTPSKVVIALALCLVYYLSNSLWLCIELHILHNLLIFCQDILEQFFALKLFEILEHFSPYQIQYWLLTGVGLVCCLFCLQRMATINTRHMRVAFVQNNSEG